MGVGRNILAASVLVLLALGLALPATGQANSDANDPDYWGETCTKDDRGLNSNVWVSDDTYTLVVLKAGTENFVFEDVSLGDELVTGNGKDVSHVITCRPQPTTTTTATSVTTVPPTSTTSTLATTTTTEPGTTTTTEPTSTTTTMKVPPTTATTTFTTSTTAPVPSSSPSVPLTTPTELPYTGGPAGQALLGLALLGLGLVTVGTTRKR